MDRPITDSLVYILFHDPHSQDDWTDWDDILSEPCEVHAVGRLVKEAPGSFTVSVSVNFENKDSCCNMIIPKNCIIDMWAITEIKFKKKKFKR